MTLDQALQKPVQIVCLFQFPAEADQLGLQNLLQNFCELAAGGGMSQLLLGSDSHQLHVGLGHQNPIGGIV